MGKKKNSNICTWFKSEYKQISFKFTAWIGKYAMVLALEWEKSNTNLYK